jgi:fructose-1,6-bisphosphatase II / sedoheptulose-1,7-bisphosphatase
MASKKIDRSLTLELARVTERAAVAAAKLIGRGDEKAADQAAVDAMRRELNALNIDGEVVIGEGERDEAPMLYIGEKVGTGDGPKVDIALDPLEGTTLTAKGMGNALAVVAMAEGGSLLNAPDVYMDKIAIGGGYPANTVDLDADPADNVKAVAKAKGVDVGLVNVCILDRPRHAEMIGKVRAAGARVTLISDGDIAGVIHCTDPSTGIDMYMGTGGAPEGVLAAAALRCTGGQMQGRLVTTDEGQKERARKMGIEDFNRKYTAEEMKFGPIHC